MVGRPSVNPRLFWSLLPNSYSVDRVIPTRRDRSVNLYLKWKCQS